MKMSKREVKPHYYYTSETCAKDIAELKLFEVDAAKRGALITASKKKFYSETKWSCVYSIAVKYDLDMTPTFAKKLMVGWFGSAVSKDTLFKHFGISGRTAKEKSSDIGLLEKLIEDHSDEMCAALKSSKLELEIKIKSIK